MMARRLPLQSGEPMIWIAAVRLLFVVTALASVAVFESRRCSSGSCIMEERAALS